MPHADFAAAQQRIAARRAQRARAHHDASKSAAASTRSIARLPFPFSSFGSAGLSVWDSIKGREGTRPEFRVGQVDAELLDEELLQLLKGQVGEGFKYFGTHITDSYTPEILLALRLVLFKLSIWNNNASYGAHLQGLRYTDARTSAPHRPPPTSWQKAAYGAITIGGRYAWAKWEEYLLSSSEDYTRPQSDTLKLASDMTEYLDTAHFVSRLPRQRTLPHPHRSFAPATLDAVVAFREPRSVVRVPQPPARLARLYRVPPVFTTPCRHLPLASHPLAHMAQTQIFHTQPTGSSARVGRRRRRQSRGRARLSARTYVCHLLPRPEPHDSH
jgi:hypothetical protein